jgi:hypothetical protein
MTIPNYAQASPSQQGVGLEMVCRQGGKNRTSSQQAFEFGMEKLTIWAPKESDSGLFSGQKLTASKSCGKIGALSVDGVAVPLR